MAFTDNCDLYAAVHDDGVNRVIRHLMRQRPSLFNYATADVAGNRELWCHKVDVTSDVVKFANPVSVYVAVVLFENVVTNVYGPPAVALRYTRC